MEKNKAKYFCENCGAEVLSKARFCPHCGKFFSAVRCPNCNYTGQVSDFKNGCPRCHYKTSDASSDSPEKSGYDTSDGLEHKLSRKSRRKIGRAFTEYRSKSAAISGDTPIWLLVLSLVILIGAIVGIFAVLRPR
ncbi:MAG: zinc ribbon domain-containing protein [Treponema sp.]|nr:zinc ribbon domain-containing protein [Treponema sp.]